MLVAQFKTADRTAYQSKASDKHLALFYLSQVYYTQGLPGRTATGPGRPWGETPV